MRVLNHLSAGVCPPRVGAGCVQRRAVATIHGPPAPQMGRSAEGLFSFLCTFARSRPRRLTARDRPDERLPVDVDVAAERSAPAHSVSGVSACGASVRPNLPLGTRLGRGGRCVGWSLLPALARSPPAASWGTPYARRPCDEHLPFQTTRHRPSRVFVCPPACTLCVLCDSHGAAV